jgi:hypothetical protein
MKGNIMKIGDKIADKVDMTTGGVVGVITDCDKGNDNFLVMIDDDMFEVTPNGIIVRKVG